MAPVSRSISTTQEESSDLGRHPARWLVFRFGSTCLSRTFRNLPNSTPKCIWAVPTSNTMAVSPPGGRLNPEKIIFRNEIEISRRTKTRHRRQQRRAVPLDRHHNRNLLGSIKEVLTKAVFDGGSGRNRTGVDGFAIRCITTLPPSQGGNV